MNWGVGWQWPFALSQILYIPTSSRPSFASLSLSLSQNAMWVSISIQAPPQFLPAKGSGSGEWGEGWHFRLPLRLGWADGMQGWGKWLHWIHSSFPFPVCLLIFCCCGFILRVELLYVITFLEPKIWSLLPSSQEIWHLETEENK